MDGSAGRVEVDGRNLGAGESRSVDGRQSRAEVADVERAAQLDSVRTR
jgi:hypothetical protein